MSEDNMFPVFQDQVKLIKKLSEKQRSDLWDCLFGYQFDGIIPTFTEEDGKLEMCFESMITSIDKYSDKKALNREASRLKSCKRDYGMIEAYDGQKVENETGKVIQGLLADLKDFKGTVKEFRREYAGQYKRILNVLDKESKFFQLISEDITRYPVISEDTHTIQNDTIQNGTVQYNAIQNDSEQCYSEQYDSVQNGTEQNDTVLDDSEQNKTVQYDSEMIQPEEIKEIYAPNDLQSCEDYLLRNGIDIDAFTGWLFKNETGKKSIKRQLGEIVITYRNYCEAHKPKK